MIRYLFILFSGCICHSLSGEPLHVVVMENQMATLPCPHAGGGQVTWSRYWGGQKQIFLTVKGQEEAKDKRYRSLANGSLVITRVKQSDASFYLCNEKKTAYLRVITDPRQITTIAPSAGGGGRLNTPRSEPGANQDGGVTDIWKVAVGAIVGAVLVLLAVLTLRFRATKRALKNSDLDKATAEEIYAEIEDTDVQLRRESDVESPYYTTNGIEMAGGFLASPMYATVNKVKTKGRSDEECVYSLAQNPQTARSDS